MTISTLLDLYTRDLGLLKKEIESYSTEKSLWYTSETTPNSGGTLCLHLIGNLKFLIGSTLGNSGYVRDRESEFSTKNIPKKELIKQIDETTEVISIGINNLSQNELLTSNFPVKMWGKEISMFYMLIHLHSHLNYHLGQINYHRRLLDIKL